MYKPEATNLLTVFELKMTDTGALLLRHSMDVKGYEKFLDTCAASMKKSEPVAIRSVKVALKVKKPIAKILDEAIYAQSKFANSALEFFANELKTDFVYFACGGIRDPVTEQLYPTKKQNEKGNYTAAELLELHGLKNYVDVFRTASINSRINADYIRFIFANPEQNIISIDSEGYVTDENGKVIHDKFGYPIGAAHKSRIKWGIYGTNWRIGVTKNMVDRELDEFMKKYIPVREYYNRELAKYDMNKETMSEEDFKKYESRLVSLKSDMDALKPAKFDATTLKLGCGTYHSQFAQYDAAAEEFNNSKELKSKISREVKFVCDDKNKLCKVIIPLFFDSSYTKETSLTLNAKCTDDYFYEIMSLLQHKGDHVGEVSITRSVHRKHGTRYYMNIPVVYGIPKYSVDEALHGENSAFRTDKPYRIAGIDLGIKQQATLSIDYYGHEDENGQAKLVDRFVNFYGSGKGYINKMKDFEKRQATRNRAKATKGWTAWSNWIDSHSKRKVVAPIVKKAVEERVQVACIESLKSLELKRRREKINNYDTLVGEELHKANLKIHKQRRFSKMLGTFPYGKIQSLLKEEFRRNGILVKEIDPKYTSMTCPFCGKVYKEEWKETDIIAYTSGGEVAIDKNTKEPKHREVSKSIETCPYCGHHIHHDHKGATNIGRSFEVTVNLVGTNLSESKRKPLTVALKNKHPIISTIKVDNRLKANDDLKIYSLNKSKKSFDVVTTKRSDFSKHGFTILGRTETMPPFLDDYEVDGFEFLGWRIVGDKSGKIYAPLEQFEVETLHMSIEGVWKKTN